MPAIMPARHWSAPRRRPGTLDAQVLPRSSEIMVLGPGLAAEPAALSSPQAALCFKLDFGVPSPEVFSVYRRATQVMIGAPGGAGTGVWGGPQ